MNHRTTVTFKWDTKFNIDTDKLPALIKLLEDCCPVDYGYVEGERVDYVRDGEIIAGYGPAERVTYVTEPQYQVMVKAEQEKQKKQKEADDEQAA